MLQRRNVGLPRTGNNMLFRKAPSLVDLCVETAIDNVRYLGNVGGIDIHLLERILPHCTKDQLMHVEKSSVGMDLSPVTDKLWKKFYEKDFGLKSLNLVIERMKEKKVAFRWLQLYEAKVRDIEEAADKAGDRLKQRYQKLEAGKQGRQVRLCSKVPPSSKKRNYGSGYDVSNVKGNLMKKAKLDLLKSREVKNLAAMRKNVVQRSCSSSRPTMQSGCGSMGKGSASSSKPSTPFDKRRL